MLKQIILFSFLFSIGLASNSPFQKSSGDIFNKNGKDPIQKEFVSKEVRDQIKENELKFKKLKECDRFKDENKYRSCISGVQQKEPQRDLSKIGKIGKDNEDFVKGFYGNLPKPEINIQKIDRMQGTNTLRKEQVDKLERDGQKIISK